MGKIGWLFLLIGIPLWAQAGGEQISVGASLTLGMTQTQALSEVQKTLEVKPLSDPSQYVVFAKGKDGQRPRWEGILTFKNGKLVAAEKLWAYENDENSVALAKSLVGVLSSVVKNGNNTCSIESVVSDAADAQGEFVILNCGRRSLKISVAKVGDYKEDASVSEVVGSQ